MYTDGFIEEGIHNMSENINELKTFLIKNRKLKGNQLLDEAIGYLSRKDDSLKFQDDVTMIAATILS